MKSLVGKMVSGDQNNRKGNRMAKKEIKKEVKKEIKKDAKKEVAPKGKVLPKEKEVKREPMCKKDKEAIRELLIARKHELQCEIAEGMKEMEEATGTTNVDWVDVAADTIDQNRAMAVAETEAQELRAINEALVRLDTDPNFGICAITGKPISPKRLQLLPYTRLSADGARQLEAEGRVGEIL